MKLTIKAKMISAFAFLVAVLIGIGVYSISSLNSVNMQTTEIDEKWLPGVDEIHTIDTEFSDLRILEYHHILANDRATKAADESERSRLLNDIQKYMTEYESLIAHEEDRRLFNALKANMAEYLELSDEMLTLSNQERDADALYIMRGASQRVYDGINELFEQLVEFNREHANMAAAYTHTLIAQKIKILSVIIALATVLAATAALIITNGIVKPVSALTASAQKIANGDLDVDINISSKDEIGVLAQAFKAMAENVNETLTNIDSAAQQVASGSKQVSDSSIALSQGATEQASSVEELTASLEEISTQTKHNANNANKANELAKDAEGNAVEGHSQMKEMLKAMDEINVSSNNISKIIKVIDEIAFQTNILALNAAVEAARAGQHGKGFAVVSEEVRNLAARSANAAKETTEMIESSIKKVEDGTRIAGKTSDALNKIVEGIAQVASLVKDIATASNEQAAGIAQVNEGIMQVSQVVQVNSATSEESAAASEELASQAEMLKDQVAKFKLKKFNRSVYSSKGLEEISPEVLRMLERMSNNNKPAYSGARHAETADASVDRISLSDKNFGKY